MTIVSFLLVMLVGFAAHRASLCTVRAVAEVLTSGTAYMLASFAKAAAWTVVVSGTIMFLMPGSSFPALERSPYLLALAGGVMFGAGAAVNGGCSLSTLQRLADGELGMIGTLTGFLVGALAWSLVDLKFLHSTLHPLPYFLAPGREGSGWVLAGLWIWALWELFRLWHASDHATGFRHRILAGTYRLSAAAAILGVAGGILYKLQGPWTYTNFLRAEAGSWRGVVAKPALIQGGLLVALLGGMLLSSLQRGSFSLRREWRPDLGKRLSGGFLMGVASANIPGGNDTLILTAIPTLSISAIGTYAAVIAGIMLVLVGMRVIGGSVPRVQCAGDRCIS